MNDTDTASVVADDEDRSWFDRFFDEARYVSDEMLQSLWGRLLKEKICSPNGVNTRVLYFIRDLERSELEAILEAFRFFIAEGVVPVGIIDKFPDLMKNWVTLSSLRLVVSSPLSSFHHVCWDVTPRKGDTISAHKAYFVFNDVYKDEEIDFPCVSLSPEGEVLSRLIDVTMTDDELKVYEDYLNNIWKDKASVSFERNQPVM